MTGEMDRGVSNCLEASSSASISFCPRPEPDEPELDVREGPGSSGPYAPALIGGSGLSGLLGRGELASVLGDARRESMDSGARKPPRRRRGIGAVGRSVEERSAEGDARPISECQSREELWCDEPVPKPEPDGSAPSARSSSSSAAFGKYGHGSPGARRMCGSDHAARGDARRSRRAALVDGPSWAGGARSNKEENRHVPSDESSARTDSEDSALARTIDLRRVVKSLKSEARVATVPVRVGRRMVRERAREDEVPGEVK